MRLSALNRKLFRDLMAMKGQALSIALVVSAGVAMYVMYQATFASLSETRRVYYERHRFGDVFASLKRAPQRVATEIAAIPGVSAMETRVVSSVTITTFGRGCSYETRSHTAEVAMSAPVVNNTARAASDRGCVIAAYRVSTTSSVFEEHEVARSPAPLARRM